MKGKAALVTGAASGLGRATALKLAAAGADLCLVDVNADGLEETASQLRALGVEVLVHATDLSIPENCHAAVAAAVDALRPARRAVQCRRHHRLRPQRHEMAQADWEKTIAINLSAPFYPDPGGDPAPARSEWRDRQCRLVGGLHRRGLSRRLLRQQGGAGAHDQGAGDGIHAQADPHQRGRAGRHGDQHRRRHDRCPRASSPT